MLVLALFGRYLTKRTRLVVFCSQFFQITGLTTIFQDDIMALGKLEV